MPDEGSRLTRSTTDKPSNTACWTARPEINQLWSGSFFCAAPPLR